MYPDGVCRVTDNYYTKTVQFQDINYQLNQNEDKTAIFDGWCDFLNYFDSSIRFQLSFINLSATRDTYARRIAIPLQGDCFDKLRTEYTGMLQSQLARGNNGLIKTKYLTFGVEADSLKAAKPRLERIETDILNNFRRLGVTADSLNGMERLRLLHGMLHMDEPQPFRFSWDWLAPSGLSVKDFIAPSAFEFKTGSSFGVGSKTGCVSFLQILAPELNDRMLADFLDMESSLIVSMHVQSVDQVKAIKTIKRKITDLQKMTIEEQKKAVRSGYDMDIIPSDLATYGTEAKKLLQELQSRNERMFLLTFLVVNVADNRQRLGNNVFQAGSIAQKYNCQLTRLDFQQEEGFMSSLPLGLNQIEIQRGLTTSSVAIFVPFTTQELFQDGKEALYCGLNALSNNLIMVDRKLLKNPNGLILGTPGSGKSFSAKREIANVFLVTNDDIIICDPEAEYGPLVEHLHGQVVKISPTSTDYLNPMDLNLNYSDDENPLSLKSDFILSLCELIVGGKDGLMPVEKTIIDRCVRSVYREYLSEPRPEKMPILEDLYNELRIPSPPATFTRKSRLGLYRPLSRRDIFDFFVPTSSANDSCVIPCDFRTSRSCFATSRLASLRFVIPLIVFPLFIIQSKSIQRCFLLSAISPFRMHSIRFRLHGATASFSRENVASSFRLRAMQPDKPSSSDRPYRTVPRSCSSASAASRRKAPFVGQFSSVRSKASATVANACRMIINSIKKFSHYY